MSTAEEAFLSNMHKYEWGHWKSMTFSAKWENSSQTIWGKNQQGWMWSIFHKISGWVQSADATSSTLFWSPWEDLPLKDRLNLHQRSYTLKQLNLLQYLQPKQRTSVFQGTTWGQILAFPGYPVSGWGLTAALLRTPESTVFARAPPSVPAGLQTRLPFNSSLIHTKRLLCREGHFTATAAALRQSLNILSLIIIFTRNSSFKCCVWLESEEQLHRGKIKALWKCFQRSCDNTEQNAFLH